MTEPAFREIQLTKKQLVFLFMASVVLAAVVFLLGVSLGRRLPATAAGNVPPGETVAEATPPAEMPPATVLTPDDKKYASELQGGKVPAAEPQPPAATAAPPSTTAPASTTPPATTATPAATPKPEAAAPPKPAASTPARGEKPAPPPAAEPAAPAGSLWLQVNAFRSRENAESEVKKLKAKGHSAVVSPGGSLFRVRVGPFPDRAAAQKAMADLKRDGFSPNLTR